MANKYQPGDTVYIVSSVRWIKEAKVLKYAGGFYTLKFTDTGGGIKVNDDTRQDRIEFAMKRYGEAKALEPFCNQEQKVIIMQMEEMLRGVGLEN